MAEFSPCEIMNHNCTKYIVVVNSNYNNDLWLTLIIPGTGTPDPFWERVSALGDFHFSGCGDYR